MEGRVEELVAVMEDIGKDNISCARAIVEIICHLAPANLARVSEVIRDASCLNGAQRCALVREFQNRFCMNWEKSFYWHETVGDGRDASPTVYIFGDDSYEPIKILEDDSASIFNSMFGGDGSCQDIQDLYDLALQDFLVFDDEFGFRP